MRAYGCTRFFSTHSDPCAPIWGGRAARFSDLAVLQTTGIRGMSLGVVDFSTRIKSVINFSTRIKERRRTECPVRAHSRIPASRAKWLDRH